MTTIKAERTAQRAANFSFGALCFALFGWVNLEVFFIRSHVGIRAQLLTAALALVLSAAAYRRCRFWWVRVRRPAHAPGMQRMSVAAGVAHCAVLVGVGLALAYTINTGFVATTAIVGAVLAFVPWSRSVFCQRQLLAAQGFLVAGGLPVLVLSGKTLHPIVLLAYTWILWTLASGLIFSAFWLQRPATPRSRRLPA